MVRNGAILLLVHLLLVGSLAAKYFRDRANYPRVWAKTLPFDPELPIRGRYVTMTVVIETDHPVPKEPAPKEKTPESKTLNLDGCGAGSGRDQPKWTPSDYFCVELSVQDGKLYGKKKGGSPYGDDCEAAAYSGRFEPTLSQPQAYFIPENAKDPAREAIESKQELWVEVSVPPYGPPRPLRLGLKRSDEGEIRPLDIR